MPFILFICSVFVLTPIFLVHGQISTAIMGETLSVTVDPQFPNPGESVTATLDDYSINSSGGTISWYLEDHELPAMRNKRSINVPSDKNGNQSKLEARLSFTNRPTLSAFASIRPIYLDVIVEPQTYVPVFYAGRALPVHGSQINLTALIQTGTGMIDPNLYSYNWQLNGSAVYGGPQKGNNRAEITVPYGLSSTLTVSVQDANGTLIGRRVISLPSVPTDLQFYEESVLYGLGRKAIGNNLRVVGNSTTIRAVPYYIDTRAVKGNVMTEWSINGVKNTKGVDDPYEINLSPQGTGKATISFKYRNLTDLIQGGERSFQVTF